MTNIASPPDGDPGWVSSADAADRLGVTVRTLYRFINEGHLTAYRFWRVIRLQPHDINQFIANSRIEPGSLDHLLPDAGADPEDDEGGPDEGET